MATPAARRTPAPLRPGSADRRSALLLFALTALFALRVAAQPLALVAETALLPRFETWHSGALPYPVLLASQAVILWWMTRTAWRVSHGRVDPSRPAGVRTIALGTIYAAVMLGRLVLGATVLANVRWFASPIPTVFHLGLASYLLVYGRFQMRHA